MLPVTPHAVRGEGLIETLYTSLAEVDTIPFREEGSVEPTVHISLKSARAEPVRKLNAVFDDLTVYKINSFSVGGDM